jgi:hypothetical protein
MKIKYLSPVILIMVILLKNGTALAADDWEKYQTLRQHLFSPAAQNFQSITCRLQSAAYDETAQYIENKLRKGFGQGNYYFDSGASSLQFTFSKSSERFWVEVSPAIVKPEGLLTPTNLQGLRNDLVASLKSDQDFLTNSFKNLRIPHRERFHNLSVTSLGDKVMVAYQDASNGYSEVKEYYRPDHHILIQPIPPSALIWDFDYTTIAKDGYGQNKRLLTQKKNGEINSQGDVTRLYTSRTVIEYAYYSNILFPVHFLVILDGIVHDVQLKECRVVR